MQNNSAEQLGYVSSAPLLVPSDNVKPIDESEISTLETLFKLLESRKEYYRSIDSISLDDGEKRSVYEQMKDNKRMQFHIQELETLLAATINKVREKQSGRDQTY